MARIRKRRLIPYAAAAIASIAVAALFLAPGSLRPPARPPAHPIASEPETAISLGFLGDLMAHDVNFAMRDYSAVYARVLPELAGQDFNFANLEAPVDDGRAYSNFPKFNIHTGYVKAAREAGINVFSLANNHSCDGGRSGIDATLRSMAAIGAAKPVFFSGLRATAGEPWEPTVFEAKGIVVGFFSITARTNELDGIGQVNYHPYESINDAEDEAFFNRIRQWKASVDVLVLAVHDGKEYDGGVPLRRRVFYERCVESGVDIVWCHHPHVASAWTRYWKDWDLKLVLPSMGNFVSGYIWNRASDAPEDSWTPTSDSAMLRVRIVRRGGRVSILAPQALLWSTFKDPRRGIVLDSTKALAESGPKEWRAFFSKRLAAQEAWARGQDAELDRPAGWTIFAPPGAARVP